MTSSPEEKPLFEQVGGLVGVRRLVDVFYDLMAERPEVKTLRELHPADLSGSRQKLYEFLVGWMGGPPLYIEKHGHPRLRARHLPFSIGVQERDEWLACMRDAVALTLPLETDAPARTLLLGALSQLADHMRNRPG